MGLLDEFDTMPDDRKSAVRQGLLTMGLNMLAGGGNFAQQVGRGGLAGLGGYQDALDKQKAEQSQKSLRQMQELQLQQAQRGAARQQRIDALPGQFYQSPAQQALAGGGGPTVGNAQRMEGMAPQFDAEGYGRALMGVDPQAGVAFQQSISKQQAAPVTVSEGQTLVDPRTGRPIFSAGQKPMAVSEGQVLFDPATGRPIFSAPKTNSPDAILAAETARRGQDFDARRAGQEVQYLTDPNTGEVIAVPKLAGASAPTQVRAGSPSGGKPLTEGQSKALLFGSRMRDAEGVLSGLAASGVDRPGNIYSTASRMPLVGGVAGAATNWTQSGGQQKVEQAQRDFINALLRRESGAVIGPDEVANAQKQYFPSIGDTPEVKEQKARNRALAIQGVLAEVPEGARDSVGGSPRPTQLSSPARVPTPMPGMVRNGYRLKPGGSPADPNSWEPVR